MKMIWSATPKASRQEFFLNCDLTRIMILILNQTPALSGKLQTIDFKDRRSGAFE